MSSKGAGTLLFTAFIVVIGLFVLAAKVHHVEPGNVGVLVYKTGQSEKGVADNPITPGWGFHALFREDVVEYPTYLQNIVWTKSQDEGSKGDDSITANTKEGLSVNMDVSIAYTLESSRVPDLYVKFRDDIDSITAGFLRNSVRQAIQDTFGQYGVEEVYGVKKEEATSNVKKLLQDRLGNDGFNFQQFTLNEIRLPENVLKSINQKISAQQDALKAEQELKRIEIEAKQKVASATAEAEAIRIQAEAVTQQGGKDYVQLQAIQKWNGVLPGQFVPGSAIPFLNLK